jgi:hypothetical protein
MSVEENIYQVLQRMNINEEILDKPMTAQTSRNFNNNIFTTPVKNDINKGKLTNKKDDITMAEFESFNTLDKSNFFIYIAN